MVDVELRREQSRRSKKGYYGRLSDEQKATRSASNSERRRNLPPEEKAELRRKDNERQKAYHARNRERINVVRRQRHRERYQRVRAELFVALGDRCSECGFEDHRALQVDHRNGGGGLHRKKTSSIKVMQQMLEDLEKYQLLCANCHQIKTWHVAA